MKALSGRVRICVRVCLLLAVAAVGMLWIGQDAQPAGASHTEVFLASSPTTNTPLSTIFLAIDGPPRTFWVRAENIDDPTGLAAFDVILLFDKTVMIPSTCNSVRPGSPGAGTDICILPDAPPADPKEPDLTFLGSTGRLVTCADQNDPADPAVGQLPDPDNRWRAAVRCRTLAPEPLGPQGGGLLAEVTFQAAPGAVPGNFSLENQTVLLNATGGADVIPATNQWPNIVIANCGDLNGDGSVVITDILLVVAAFGSTAGDPTAEPPVPPSENWNADADLNKDGSVVIPDILLVVQQFGQFC